MMDILVLVLAFVLAVNGQYSFNESSTVVNGSDGRVRGFANKTNVDFILGGLFPVHSDADGGASCGPIRLERGVERVEAMLYALDLINNNASLLPGIHLGYDIRDTCTSENLGLDEALDLTVSGELDTCNTGAGNNSAQPSSIVIGAASSGVSVPVATLLRLFQVPQISYSSSSARLNNRDRYSYFFRTISADNLQAEAMIDICLRYNWTYVSTIYADDFYGEPGIDQFHFQAQENGLCIDINEGLGAHFNDSDYYRVAQRLLNSTANVVVLFVNSEASDRLFEQLELANQANGTNRRFQWIASDGWARAINVVSKYSTSLSGLLGTAPSTVVNQGFHNYFSRLLPDNNLRDAWFEEFYEASYDCSLNAGAANPCSTPYQPITNLTSYAQGNFIPLVIDAVFSAAHALHNFLEFNCDSPIVWFPGNQTCVGQKNLLTGANLLGFIQNLSFVSPTGKRVTFDSSGNAAGQYDIVNYQKSRATDQFEFVTIGAWDAQGSGERLQLGNLSAQFGVRDNGMILDSPRESHCHRCLAGQYLAPVVGSCCGRCVDCLGPYFSNSRTASQCSKCPDFYYWGNDPLNRSTLCVRIEEQYLQYSSPWSVILMILAICGLVAVVFVCVVFGIFWSTPIVKSSGREQMVLLLIGISLCFVLTFFFVSKPSIAVCFFQRLGLWLSFSIIIGALLIKLIRIARIFLRGQASSRPRFVSPPFQVLFTFIVVAGQLLLVVVALGVDYPVPSESLQKDGDNFPQLILTCHPDGSPQRTTTLLLLVIYDSAIIIACNVLAVMTIRFPANFNESKYVAFTTFSLGLIWLAFIPTYYSTEHRSRTAVISFALNFSAIAVLLCMFGARVFVILFHPSRNVAEYSAKPSQKPPSFSLNVMTETGTQNEKNANSSDRRTAPMLSNLSFNKADLLAANSAISAEDSENKSPTTTAM